MSHFLSRANILKPENCCFNQQWEFETFHKHVKTVQCVDCPAFQQSWAAPLAFGKGMKIEREEDELLTTGDDMESGPPMGHGGHYTISFNPPVDEETESWRD